MTASLSTIYGNYLPQGTPAYSVTEAARYLHIAPATLRSWVFGRTYPREIGAGFFEPLIQPAADRLLSFANLVEAHVLRALRTEHGVSIRAVRTALDCARQAYGVERVLLCRELWTTGGELFLEKYGELVNLSRSGQMALRMMLEESLRRVEWDQDIPTRLYPFLKDSKIIAIDPHISFGRPVILRRGISTAVIADRIDAGESIVDVAKDYDLKPTEVKTAILYERAA